MCTVTYLPYSKNCFILTSNRDEDILRQVALPVNQYKIGNTSVFFPKDPKAGGTWIATGSNGFTVCLFNGAFKKHTPSNNYRKSRGLVLLDFFNYSNHLDFIENYDFNNIEPFSLVFVHHQASKVGLCELKWDGEKTHHFNHDSSLPHIWSSVTLYSEEVIKQRESWFYDWVKLNEHFTKESILMFHHFGGSGDKENDLVMNRGAKKTVSICSISKRNETEIEVTYEDVINKKVYSNRIICC
jgi:hypothetical protein